MSLLADIERLITEHGSAAIMRERLALLADQAKALEQKVKDLEQELAATKKKLGETERQLAAKSRADEFLEHRGALFKRKADGSYHQAVYCPICHKPTGAIIGEMPFACTEKCGWIAAFTPDDLSRVMSELPK
jgi:hypothetical protein